MQPSAPPVSLRGAIIPLSDLGLQYVECGAGRRVVVLLHGYTDSWRSFRLVLPQLASACRCLAIDQRGHGESRYAGDDLTPDDFAGDVIEFMERLGIESAALVGHSMGSFIARKVALRRPDLVERLILVGAGLRADNPVVRELEAQVMQLQTAVPRPFVVEFQASCVHDRGTVPVSFFNDCVDASSGLSVQAWKAVLAGMLGDDDRDRLAQVACPTLVIGGREDAIFGRQEQEQLAQALPRGQLLLYERCGHSPHWEQPVRFSEDVLRFLGGRA